MVELTIKRAWAVVARRNAARVALRCGARALTYAELDALANRIANALADAGCGLGDRVAVVLPNGMEYVALAIACAKAGFVMVPHNYRFTAPEFALQLADCGARAIVYGEAFADEVVPAAKGRSGLIRIAHGRAAPGDLGTLESLCARASAAEPVADVRETDTFYLGYTSGTTGRPKGAMVSQRNRALAYHYWALEFGITDARVALHSGPFHHTAPFTFTLTQLYVGGEVVILEHFDPMAALAAIERYRVNWGFMVPFMFDRILELGPKGRAAHALHTLDMLVSGGSALPTVTKERLLEAFPAVGLHEFYGATEAGVMTNLRPTDQARKRRCVGKPVFDTEVEIRDAEGKALPAGEVGEIWISGPTMFSGYFGAPERTAEVYRGDWCTLGDLGRVDDEGYLYIVDRVKDVIKSGGVNVYPVEIEEVLLAHPGVRECAVIAIPDERWGEAVHAVIVPSSQHLDQAALREACRGQLAGYKVPRSFEFRAELPRNANGKILKRTLRDEYVRRHASQPVA